jgi:predicted metalloendopeptidase
VVSTPDYLRNLTVILRTESKRNVANYMLWRAAQVSLGFLNKAARDITEEYSRNITGKKEETPRWKQCVGSAAGSFSAAGWHPC